MFARSNKRLAESATRECASLLFIDFILFLVFWKPTARMGEIWEDKVNLDEVEHGTFAYG
jgi:hypothetical protein